MHGRLAVQQTSVFGSQIETRFISKSSTTEYPYSKPKRSGNNRRKRRDARYAKISRIFLATWLQRKEILCKGEHRSLEEGCWSLTSVHSTTSSRPRLVELM